MASRVATASASKVSLGVYRQLEATGRANVLIEFGGNSGALKDLGEADPEKVRQALVDLASVMQKKIIYLLNTDPDAAGTKHESFWISNSLFVENAPEKLVSKLRFHDTVVSIDDIPIVRTSVRLKFRPAARNITNDSTKGRRLALPHKIAWGVSRIGAPSLWDKNVKGAGIVIGSIDDGVRVTHEALAGRWRATKGWYDPRNKALFPYDEYGHGTHTIGTMVGINGLGVAPSAQFISCKACYTDKDCDSIALLACAQFMMCPTDALGNNPDCSLKPHVINNSWGSDSRANISWVNSVIDSWRAVGIIPIFAVGNKGPHCGTVDYPSDNPNVIAVGASGRKNWSKDALLPLSSRGPTADGRIKPDVSAPGEDIKSLHIDADDAYAYDDGTSMAAPHVTGAVALLLSMQPDLSYSQLYSLLTTTADTSTLVPTNQICGGKSDAVFPNNNNGYGRINVWSAYKKLLPEKNRKRSDHKQVIFPNFINSDALRIRFDKVLDFMDQVSCAAC